MSYRLPRDLEKALRGSKRSPEVEAAVLTALGLLVRMERRKPADRNNGQSPSYEADPIHIEVRHYRQALALDESASTHCYLAECLFELQMEQEAVAHAKRALALSPMHPLARRLVSRPVPAPDS